MDRNIGIGIDTGGTYTDAVIYSFAEKKVLAAAKALTTRNDLSIGILESLDKLPGHLIREARVIALSTTLATNACVEDKGGRAKLVFFGGDERVINELGGKYGLPPADQIHIQESYTDFYGGVEKEPDWNLYEKSTKEKFNRLDGAGIVELYAMKNNGVVEKKAKEIFQRHFNIPVVCGHELFSELNSLQRGASALLNARLFPVIEEFLAAIKKAIAARGISASVVIVRSDGSLMSEEFASLRPVETLLCGPAASAAGGLYLSGEKNCVIVDMGGTTTDMILVKNGIPVQVTGGVSVGKWRTFVHGFFIKTMGLGGDSAVHYSGDGLRLEEYRVVPFCVAAYGHPEIIENLKNLVDKGAGHTLFIHEHFILVNDIKDPERYTEAEKRFCAALRNGPLILKDAAAVLDTDIYNLNVSRLLKEGVVQLCGLTPTDIMHIKNDFSDRALSGGASGTGFCREASVLGARFIALNLGITVDELCNRVYEEVRRKLYVNIVKILLEHDDRYYAINGVDRETERFIYKSYESAKRELAGTNAETVNGAGQKKPVTLNFKTDFSLVGVGAPIHIFLSGVAELLGTKAAIPEYSSVANALGAVASRVHAAFKAEIRPDYSPGGITGYTVFGYNSTATLRTLKEAEEYAVREALEGAKIEAAKRGAGGKLDMSWEMNRDEGTTKDGVFYMGSGVTAHAVGELA